MLSSNFTTQQMEKVGNLNTFLLEMFKNHKLMKIFQNENYEFTRSQKFITEVKEKSRKIKKISIFFSWFATSEFT